MGDFFAGNGELGKDPQLDLTSRTFNPRKFIRRTLSGLSHSDFERELELQISAAREQSGEALKQLIKDNLGVFIDSKDAMSSVYQTDRELFTGEALQGVSETFHAASEDCKTLVEPTLSAYTKIQRNHTTQELLEKMYTVLRVPGALYEYCGVYVAARRPAGEEEEKKEKNNKEEDDAGTKKQKNEDDTSDEEEEEGEEEEEEEEDEARRGALEADMTKALVEGASAPAMTAAELRQRYTTRFEDEEVFLWYDTPLVRLREAEAQRHRVEERSNYEAAVLHLRRAMLYLEENYNLEEGTMLGVEEEEEEEDDDEKDAVKDEAEKRKKSEDHGRAPNEAESVANSTQPAGHASSSLPRPEAAGNSTSTTAAALAGNEDRAGRRAGRGVFISQFAIALLKAALYLVNQLAEELTHVNAADTVFIEDVLSMMMDVTIATVKLRHFAHVLRRLLHPERAALHESGAKEKAREEDVAGETKTETKRDEGDDNEDDDGEGGDEGAEDALAGLRKRLARNLARTADHSEEDEEDEEDDDDDTNSIAADLMAEDASWKDSFASPAQDVSEGGLQSSSLYDDQAGHTRVRSTSDSIDNETAAALPPTSRDGADRKSPVVRLMQHPAQYYIGLTRNQHTKLMLGSAAALLQEARDWRRKAATLDTTRGTGANDNATGSVAGREPGASSGTASLLGIALQSSGSSSNHTGGLLGNVQDSFVAPITASSSSVAQGTQLPQQSAYNVSTGGYGNDQAAQTAANALSFTPAWMPGSGEAGTTTATATLGNGVQGNNNNTVEDDELRSAVPLLYAFRTPEMDFALDTTFVLGTMDMAAVLESSALQVRLHSRALLQQLGDRAQAASAVMSQAGQLTSYAVRLTEACMGNLEHVLVSYWGGIATAIHGGVFDFQPAPDSVLYRMLTGEALLGGVEERQTKTKKGSTAVMQAGQASPTQALDTNSGVQYTHADMSDERSDAEADKTLPPVYFLPVLADALLAEPNASVAQTQTQTQQQAVESSASQSHIQPQPPPSMASFASQHAAATTLRDLSVAAVRRMIQSAATTMQSLFVAFVNRAVLAGFVRGLASYSLNDLQAGYNKETIELHAAVLFEVILAQWERMMGVVSEAVLHVKIAVGESCASASATMQVQVEVVNELLAELEQLRTSCMRCYLHGMGLLAKIYITLMPSLQKRVNRVTLEHRVRARLSRDYVSSSLPNKLLNVLAVMADRVVPFLQRDAEAFDSADLFAAKAEEQDEDGEEAGGGGGGNGTGSEAAGAATGRAGLSARRRASGGLRHRLLRRRGGMSGARPHPAMAEESNTYEGEDEGSNNNNNKDRELPSTRTTPRPAQNNGATASKDTAVDPLTQFVATAHSRLVQDHLAEHEELLQALFSNVLLCFIDMLHLKCQSVCGDDTVQLADRESVIVECMADALAIPTTVSPILLDHLLQPCLFELLVRYRSSAAQEQRILVDQKRNQFTQRYLGRLGEHCQLAVDAMLGMYLSVPQQQIAMTVRRAGFMMPLFDWQRASGHLTAAVRPYLADCIACIATAQETLHWIHQPALGAAATQRLVADLALSFVTAATANVNGFELSAECSADFMLYGTLLLEAEGQTILGLIDSILTVSANSSSSNNNSNTPPGNSSSNNNNNSTTQVLPELLLAQARLQNMVQTLITSSSATCVALGLSKRTPTAALLARNNRNNTEDVTATHHIRFVSLEERNARRTTMVATALAELKYMITAVSSHLEESSLATSSSLGLLDREAMQTIAERLSKRKEGYQLQHATASTMASGAKPGGKRVTLLHGNKHRAEKKAENTKEESKGGEKEKEKREKEGAAATLATGLKKAADKANTAATTSEAKADAEGGRAVEEQNERAASLYQHAVKEGAKVTRRRVRKTTTTAAKGEGGQQAQGSEAQPAEATEAAAGGVHEEGEKPTARPPHRRLMRRTAVVPVLAPSESRGALSEERPVRERRANRFKRTNVV